MATLDWQLREVLPQLSQNGRLNVLIALILRANVRNRCWPSLNLISSDTGFGLEAVSKAKKWLLTHKAIDLVKYGQRLGDEKKTPPRQHVYQLTGVIEIDGTTYNYLYTPVQSFGIRSFNPSANETSVSEGEGSSIFKGDSKKESAASDEARVDTVQSSENTSSVKASDSTPAAQGPAKEARARTPRQIESVAAAEALASAMGVTLASTDYGLYKKHAALLVSGGVTAAEFAMYVKRVRRQADGKWTVSVTSLTSNGRISEYITARDAHRAKQQAGEAQGAWSGETASAQYHQPAVIVPESTTVNADVLTMFEEVSHE